MKHFIDDSTIWEGPIRVEIENYPAAVNGSQSYFYAVYKEIKKNDFNVKEVKYGPIPFSELNEECVFLASMIAAANKRIVGILERDIKIKQYIKQILI